MPRDFDESTLWRISAYERMRAETGHSGFTSLDGASTRVLPTTLHNELSDLRHRRRATDALDTIAACVRHRESALLLLSHGGLLWPLTLFPQQGLYHLPRCVLDSLQRGGHDLAVVGVEPPGLRPPGHFMHERIASGPGYRPLAPLLWAVALHAPRVRLLDEIGGRAAYRVAAGFTPPAVTPDGATPGGATPGGAMGPALQRLRTEIASLPQMASWPGMDAERAARLLNAVYLQGALIVLRSHAAARDAAAAGADKGLLGWFRLRR